MCQRGLRFLMISLLELSLLRYEMLTGKKGDKKKSVSRKTTTAAVVEGRTLEEVKGGGDVDATSKDAAEGSVKTQPTTTKRGRLDASTASKKKKEDGSSSSKESSERAAATTKRRKLSSASRQEVGGGPGSSPTMEQRREYPVSSHTLPSSTSTLSGLRGLLQQQQAMGSGSARSTTSSLSSSALRGTAAHSEDWTPTAVLSRALGGGGGNPISVEAFLSAASNLPSAATSTSPSMSFHGDSAAAGRIPTSEALLTASLMGLPGGHRSIADLQAAQLLERYDLHQRDALASILAGSSSRMPGMEGMASTQQFGTSPTASDLARAAGGGLGGSPQHLAVSRMQQAAALQGAVLQTSQQHQFPLLGAGPLSVASTNLTTPLMRASAGGRAETTHEDLLRAAAFAASDPLGSSSTIQALRMRQDLSASGLSRTALGSSGMVGNLATLAAMGMGGGGHVPPSSIHYARQVVGRGGAAAAAAAMGGRLHMPMTTSDTSSSTTGHPPVILSLQLDRMRLSPFQCLARQQIELFEATEKDVQSGARGRNNPIILGQVGIRCKHCAHLSPTSRNRGAVYFPTKVSDPFWKMKTSESFGYLGSNVVIIFPPKFDGDAHL